MKEKEEIRKITGKLILKGYVESKRSHKKGKKNAHGVDIFGVSDEWGKYLIQRRRGINSLPIRYIYRYVTKQVWPETCASLQAFVKLSLILKSQNWSYFNSIHIMSITVRYAILRCIGNISKKIFGFSLIYRLGSYLPVPLRKIIMHRYFFTQNHGDL